MKNIRKAIHTKISSTIKKIPKWDISKASIDFKFSVIYEQKINGIDDACVTDIYENYREINRSQAKPTIER